MIIHHCKQQGSNTQMLLEHHGCVQEEIKVVCVKEGVVNLFGNSFPRLFGIGAHL